MDLTTLTDDALFDHLNAVLNEQERRQGLSRIPVQVEELRDRYVKHGGNPADVA